MHPDPKTAPKTRDCKVKAVNPPFRSVSTPRWTKDLPVVGPVNPETALSTTEGSASAAEWSAEGVSERLRSELTSRAWNRLVRGAACRGISVEQLVRAMLSEVA